jgi:hypothetical protein
MKKDYIDTMSEYTEGNKPQPRDENADTQDSKGGDKPGLWENIRNKKDREGKKYKPAKPGDPDRPDPEAYKKAQS